MNIISSAMLNRKLNRENANATIDERNSVRMTAGIAMNRVLMKKWARSPGPRR